MYIRAAKKKNGVTDTRYSYLQLVENIRTEKGPRQKLVLNLGNISIHPSQYPPLARRIEELLTGQQTLFDINPEIEKHARTAFKKIFNKQSHSLPDLPESSKIITNASEFKNIEADQCRSIGPEYVCHSIWQELELNQFFKEQSVPESVIPILEATVVGRLCDPGSERHTHFWAQNNSSIYDLLNNPQYISQGSFYRATDRLIALQKQTEKYLSERESHLFSLEDTYLFFDLTNSYFEGQCKANPKAKFGRSKEKRSDCRLVAMGMVVDERGFSKGSRFFSGNRSEPTTLNEMMDALEETVSKARQKRTVIMDAGIASEDNIKELKKRGYSYIVVNRGKIPDAIQCENMQTIRGEAGSDTHIEVKRFNQDEEILVLCRSEQKRKKEESMRMRIESLFIARLEYIKSGLKKNGKHLKRYDKILELAGRLKEKYPAVARLYEITVMPENTETGINKNIHAIDITWQKKDVHEKSLSEEGCYLLRTDRVDLTDQEIWELYIMLRRIEYSFLCMKSHLGLRPNFHQTEKRVDAHMFISVMAYHILQIVEQRLRDKDDHRKWDTIRQTLSTHQRLTVTVPGAEQGVLKIRLNTTAEPMHREIYSKLGLSCEPLPRRIWYTSCSEEKNPKMANSASMG